MTTVQDIELDVIYELSDSELDAITGGQITVTLNTTSNTNSSVSNSINSSASSDADTAIGITISGNV